jgi:hypothetical protein
LRAIGWRAAPPDVRSNPEGREHQSRKAGLLRRKSSSQ